MEAREGIEIANWLRSEPRSLPINQWYTRNLVAQNFTVILPQKKRPIVSYVFTSVFPLTTFWR
jgi:hypothetical protein